jgi:hypothetical protein
LLPSHRPRQARVRRFPPSRSRTALATTYWTCGPMYIERLEPVESRLRLRQPGSVVRRRAPRLPSSNTATPSHGVRGTTFHQRHRPPRPELVPIVPPVPKTRPNMEKSALGMARTRSARGCARPTSPAGTMHCSAISRWLPTRPATPLAPAAALRVCPPYARPTAGAIRCRTVRQVLSRAHRKGRRHLTAGKYVDRS